MKSLYPTVIIPAAVIIGLCCFEGAKPVEQGEPSPAQLSHLHQEAKADSSKEPRFFEETKTIPVQGIPLVTRSIYHLTQWGLEGIGNQLP